MSEARIYDLMDYELEQMVNPITAARRQEREQVARMSLQTANNQKQLYAVRMNRRRRIWTAAGRFSIGIVFLGAIAREWILPGFGLALTAACFIWSCFSLRRGRRR